MDFPPPKSPPPEGARLYQAPADPGMSLRDFIDGLNRQLNRLESADQQAQRNLEAINISIAQINQRFDDFLRRTETIEKVHKEMWDQMHSLRAQAAGFGMFGKIIAVIAAVAGLISGIVAVTLKLVNK